MRRALCPLFTSAYVSPRKRELKNSGIEAELVVFPREPHGFAEPAHISDRAARTVKRFRAHDTPARSKPTTE